MTRFLSNVFDINIVDQPSWYKSKADYSWFQPPNADGLETAVNPRDPNQGGPNPDGSFSITPPASSQIDLTHKWCGATARENYYLFVASGGHKASYDNSVYSYGSFVSENPVWTRPIDPTHNIPRRANGQAWEADGKPASRHGYWNECYIPALGTSPERGRRWFSGVCGAPAGDATGTKEVTQTCFFDSDVLAQASYDPDGYNQDFPVNITGSERGAVAWDSGDQKVYCQFVGNNGRQLRSYDPIARTWSGSLSGILPNAHGGAIDPVRRIFAINNKSATLTDPIDGLTIVDISSGRVGEFVSPNVSGPFPNGPFTENPGMEFEPISGKFVAFDSDANGQLYILTVPSNYRSGNGSLNSSANWQWSTLSISGSPEAPDQSQSYHGTFTKFRYISSLGCFAIVVNGNGSGIWVCKIPASGI